ncbi:hypothetical protein [Reichenbachiella ulvae]|uniref:DUF4468 domain-containing protein n=1 Tax=Reichenbachiella ulvae TaxID=2980104 RepID=A0ABT3CPF4_9BACT|nr:hypothetical protein [Reichenbachiella ulvae]MCV9385514.1 hypothetical protein [Reichenbachiella ulvae]
MKKLLLALLLIAPFLCQAQTDSWIQINYEELTPQIMGSLQDEIEKMNLEFIRFNFYQQEDAEIYPVEFLRKGVDITALGGLEYILFRSDGSIYEKRFKFYSDELLISTSLEMIMIMQEKTKDHQLKYLTRIETEGQPAYYQANTQDSVFVFNERMEFLKAEAANLTQ